MALSKLFSLLSKFLYEQNTIVLYFYPIIVAQAVLAQKWGE